MSKRRKMDTDSGQHSLTQHVEIHIFKSQDNVGKVFVVFNGIVNETGFLDLSDDEKTHLERCFSTQTSAKLTINSDQISFSIERFNLNRLTDQDLNNNNQYIQVAKESSLVKYNNNYYFVHDSLATDFRRLAHSYGKDASEMAFGLEANQLKVDAGSQTLKLASDTLRKVRKFDLYFGPFEYYAPICADAAAKYKRYVTNKPGHLILIDNYMVECLNLETAVNKIDKKSYFTVIPQSAEPEILFQMPSAEHSNVSSSLALRKVPANYVSTSKSNESETTMAGSSSLALQKTAEYDCPTSSALRKVPANYVSTSKSNECKTTMAGSSSLALQKTAENDCPTSSALRNVPANYISTTESNECETTKTGSLKKRIYYGLNLIPLSVSKVPETIWQIVNKISNDNTEERMRNLSRHYEQAKENEASYICLMNDCILMELAEQQKQVEKLNMTNVQLLSTDKENEYYLMISDANQTIRLKEAIRGNVVDYFELKPSSGQSTQSFRFNTELKGSIRGVQWNGICVRITKNENSAKLNVNYDISFEINTIPFDVQRMALNYVQEHNLFRLLIQNRSFDEFNTDDYSYIVFDEDYEIDSDLNEEQRYAVEYIVQRQQALPPYILYGPPGTGKTKTLVAAIEKILETTNDNILVAAATNQACDEITERLIKKIDPNVMLRIYAKSHSPEKVKQSLRIVSNYDEETKSFDLPDLTCIYNYRVVICTLCTSNCLSRARKHKIWKADHFNVVIIDECANTHQTSALVAIAGLVTKENEICAKIVLAGDPKQLEAVTKSEDARNCGYSQSYLEHLIQSKLYKPNPKYDPRFITFLVKNYRSHHSILYVPNELFYENRLVACGTPETINLFIGSDVLLSKDCPIIFIPSQGNCDVADVTSWVNHDEIRKVREIVNKLIGSQPPNAKRTIAANDIGIISPYRGQTKELKRNFRSSVYEDLLIGTTEMFQGSEKTVIIISTVRNGGKLGFLNDYRRFNVAITRAKSLLVVIGDIETLRKDRNWGSFIDYCAQHGCIDLEPKK